MRMFIEGTAGTALLAAGFYAATMEFTALACIGSLVGIIGGGILWANALTTWSAPDDLP